ncbi:MAG: fluoride efflux transporter CrcB [Leptospirales bacterium]
MLPWIFIGGAIGASARYLVVLLLPASIKTGFPWPTVFVNLAGSLIIGFLWAAFEKHKVSENVRNFIFIAILGSFTTFSTFSNETAQLLRDLQYGAVLLNVALHSVVGIFFAFIGYVVGAKIVFPHSVEQK